MSIELVVNGCPHTVEVEPDTPLLLVLRNHLRLTGAKFGCGLEQCGACAILVDNKRVLSCSRPVADFESRHITTIEGLAEPDRLSDLQQAFVDFNAAQCGYCTAGMIMGAAALLQTSPAPTRTQIRDALSDHICRCGSHNAILSAVESVAKKSAGEPAQ